MKLLLTSEGLTNQSIIEVLVELAGRPVSELKIGFVPTAANIENEDKSWLIDDLVRIKNLKPALIDIVDIAALTPEQTRERLGHMDVLVFGGGDTKYLLEVMKRQGLVSDLSRWVESKVYMGISAGSVVTSRVINPAGDDGLGWVDFAVVPHMNAPYAQTTQADIESAAKLLGVKVYWLDDNSAIAVNGNDVRVVTEGQWQEFPKRA